MIFISYSRKDKEVAENITNYLKKCNIKFWIDSNNLNLRKSLSPQIINGIAKSNIFIIILSKNSKNSIWVLFELICALYLKKIIVRIEI